MASEVRTSDGTRIWLEFCGDNWWKLHIDTGDYERIVDLNDDQLDDLGTMCMYRHR